jgi:hypothetical protein
MLLIRPDEVETSLKLLSSRAKTRDPRAHQSPLQTPATRNGSRLKAGMTTKSKAGMTNPTIQREHLQTSQGRIKNQVCLTKGCRECC